MVNGGMTTGVKNALARGDVHSMCADCGFPLPKYPGRYPKACPSCGADKKSDESIEEGDQITIHGRTGTIVEDCGDEIRVEWLDGAQEVIEL